MSAKQRKKTKQPRKTKRQRNLVLGAIFWVAGIILGTVAAAGSADSMAWAEAAAGGLLVTGAVSALAAQAMALPIAGYFALVLAYGLSAPLNLQAAGLLAVGLAVIGGALVGFAGRH